MSELFRPDPPQYTKGEVLIRTIWGDVALYRPNRFFTRPLRELFNRPEWRETCTQSPTHQGPFCYFDPEFEREIPF